MKSLVAQVSLITYHCKIAGPQRSASSATIHAGANHAVPAALAAIEREVLVLPAYSTSVAALTKLHLDVFDVERV